MPSESKEPVALYIAKSLHGLNEMVDLKVEKSTSVKIYCNTAAKMYKAAEKAYIMKDEERAYVMYMKFANVVQQIKKTKGYVAGDKKYFDSLMGFNNLMPSVDKAEELSQSLSNRYSELKEAVEIKARLDQRDKEEEEAKSKPKDGGLVNGVNGDAKPIKEEIGEDGSISSEELYRLFNNKDISVLVLDARSEEHFDASHIICDKCANIHEGAIKPGCTVAIIEKGLDSSAKALFSQRGLADYIVMLDWDSSVEDLTQHSTLGSLKDAIYKWDSTMTLKHEPLVLAGGYERWILKYPMYSTNPKVAKPDKGKKINQYASLDFDYPTSLEDEEPEQPPEPKPAPAPNQVGHQNGPIAPGAVAAGATIAAGLSMPSIQRHLKPGMPQSPSHGSLTISNGTAGPRLAQTAGVIRPAVNSGVAPGGAPIAAYSYSKPAGPTGTGDARPSAAPPAVAASVAVVSRPGVPDRSTKPQGNLVIKSEPAPSEDELPPSYDDVREKEKDDAEQEQLMQEHKSKENQARLELERMRHGKAKAENEQLRKEKEDVEKQLEVKIAALQTLQKQLQEQQAKQEEEKKQAEEKAQAEEQRKAQEVAVEGESAEAAPTAGAGSQQEEAVKDTSKPEPAASTTTKPSPAKEAPKPAQNTTQPQPKPQQPKQLAPTAKTPLPPGWEKKLDPRSKRYFYIDHNNGRTQWHPPTAVGPAGAGTSRAVTGGTVARPRDGSSPRVSPQHAAKLDSPAHKPSTASTSADSINASKTRLKSSADADFSSSKPGGLKRSFSSPNIAKMVMEEDARPTPVAPLVPKPSFDRSSKPSERLTNNQQVRPVTISRMRNLAPVYGSMGRGRTGLKNLGNTCFMNSVVQCLSATTLLSEYFINDMYLRHINRNNPLGRGGDVVEEFAVVIKALWSGQYRSISPRDLRDTVYKYVPEFRKHMGHHHDSQEFLLFLMDGLHEDVNQVTKREYIEEPDYAKMSDEKGSLVAWENHKRFNRSIIVELFQGQFKSTVKCLTCQHKSVKFDAFTFLTLPIPSSGRTQLKDCLANFSKAEKMTGDNAIYCSRCKTKRNSEKNIHIWKLPPVLLICMKRFYHEGMWRQKLQTMVEYPLQDMDMSPFTIGPRRKGYYNLYAVSNHTGTLDGGHYTAYCKNAVTRRWFKYDDHEVYDVSAGNIKSSAAYILFYSSIDLPPP